MIGIGVLGIGYWGPNIVRNFNVHPSSKVVVCCDKRNERLDFIKKNYPAIETSNNYKDILKRNDVDLIAICTPVNTHFIFAKEALLAGKHVLVMKPMTSTSAQAEELLNIAQQKNLKIFVDHTFVYTGSVRKIKDLITSNELGDLYYFDSVRVNLGLFQHDVNVLWDLAPHDISIMHYFFNSKPESVIATGAAHINNGLENIAYLSVYYPDNLIGHIHANWLSPVKVRQTLIAGTKKMVVWDDNEPSEKVRIYDKGIDVIDSASDVYNLLIQYRSGDMYCPKIDTTEALTTEVSRIIDNLNGIDTYVSTGEDGLMTVKILEAAQKSIKNRGKEIKL